MFVSYFQYRYQCQAGKKMILVWKDAKAFQRHLEDMKNFRRSHPGSPGSETTLFRGMPAPHDINFPCNTGGGRHTIKTGGKTIVVPIWKIALPGGSQN